MFKGYQGSVIIQPNKAGYHAPEGAKYMKDVHKRITRARKLIALVKKSYSKTTVLMIHPGVRTLLIKGEN